MVPGGSVPVQLGRLREKPALLFEGLSSGRPRQRKGARLNLKLLIALKIVDEVKQPEVEARFTNLPMRVLMRDRSQRSP